LILVFYAFGLEAAPLKRRLKNRQPLKQAGLRGVSAEIAGKELTLVATGIGHRRAREAAQRAFDVLPAPEMVIATGVAGGLTPRLKPGDIVLADRILASLAEGAATDDDLLLAAEDVREIARALGAAGLGYATGALLTSHRALATADEKRLAHQRTGAIAVEMETAALASEASRRGLPFASVRTVLDPAGDQLLMVPPPPPGSGWARRRIAAAGHVVRNPAMLLDLPRMAINLSRATRSIADALEAIARHSKFPPDR